MSQSTDRRISDSSPPATLPTDTQIIEGDIWFLNLPARVQGGLPPVAGPGAGWVPLQYGLEHVKGVGLATGAASPAGTLVLDLELTGYHILHIGQNPVLRVWLQGEDGCCDLPGDGSAVADTALPPMDLTGKKLCIAPQRSTDRNSHVSVFYIRAEPCAPPVRHKKLIVTNDGHGVFHRGMDNAKDIHSYIYPYRNSDVFRFIWGLYGGAALTLKQGSRFNDLINRSDDQIFAAGSMTFMKSIRRFAEQGLDPLAIVRDATREYDMELHYYCRLAAFYGPYPHLEWTTQFFRDNPKLRCQTAQGDFINMMSYAHAKVQDHMLAYFDELLDYEPEGICLAFNRGLPLMVCEQPVLDAFEQRTGRAAVLPADCDHPDMLAVRHELLADFVARVKELANRRGKVLSCIAPRDFEHNKLMGLDIQLMADRGLFESMMIGAGHGDDPQLNRNLEPVKALQVHNTKVYPGGSNVRPHGQAWQPKDLKANAQHMAAILKKQFDGAWFWDADGVFGYDWQAMRSFGDPEKLNQIIQGSWPKSRSHQTTSIHDLVVGRYNPWHAY